MVSGLALYVGNIHDGDFWILNIEVYITLYDVMTFLYNRQLSKSIRFHWKTTSNE